MRKVFNFILLALIISLPTYFSWIGKNNSSFIFLISGIVTFLLINIDKLEFFKVYGVEAKLKATMAEANATIKQLRKLAAALAEPTISLLAMSGVHQPIPLAYRWQKSQRINEILTELHTDENQIREINDVFFLMLIREHARKITAGISNIPEKYIQCANTDHSLLSSNDYLEYLRDQNLLSTDRQELIDDLKYFMENRKFRRPDFWEINVKSDVFEK